MMNQTVNLLEDIAYGQKMGIAAVDRMLARVSQAQLVNNLQCQRGKYTQKLECAHSRLEELGKPTRQTGLMERMGLEIGITVNLRQNSSPSHTAEMMIRGGTMGLIELAQSMKENPKAAEEAKTLARDCIGDEIDNINMWKYLL